MSSRTILAVAVLLLVVAPAIAGSRIEREFPMPAHGRLEVDADAGAIHVQGGSGAVARVVITSREDDLESLFDIEFEPSSKGVTITAERRGGLLGSLLGRSRRAGLEFRIEVPRATRVDLDTAGGAIEVFDTDGEARLDTSGGPIHVERVSGPVSADTSGGGIRIEQVVGDVSADTSGGPIHVSDVRGDVAADTSGGSITIEQVTGDVSADTSGGGIVLEAIGGRVSAETSGGGIEASLASGNKMDVELSTSGGGITLHLPHGASYDVDAVSSGGRVETDIPVEVSGSVEPGRLRGVMGAGGASLRLRTSGGPIRIRER